MRVGLIWATPNAELIITDTARVSNPSNKGKDGSKLIRYLIDNKHWSPFEHAYASFEIETSRAISQQITRHRSFTYQEWSQRYSEAPGMEPIQLRMQAEKNRQSSTDAFDSPDLEYGVRFVIDAAQDLYQKLLDAGVARECARMVLPLTTATTIVMTGSVRSWIHYLELRTDQHTQLEHREIALAIQAILALELPTIASTLGWSNAKELETVSNRTS